MSKKTVYGFTLIELLVVISIIGLLASVIFVAIGNSRSKARDARRAADMRQINIALNLFYDKYGCLPKTTATTCPGAIGYSEANGGGWDYSSQGGFLTFLQTDGFLASPPVDPINNMTGDGTPAGTNAYKYFCYATGGTPGLHFGYYSENSGYVVANNKNSGGFSDSSFVCQ